MNIISLFSGAGGLDLGLIQAGHKIIWANDNDPDTVATYRFNIGDHIELADIAEVDLESISGGDVVVGGFPCQGFSLANLNGLEMMREMPCICNSYGYYKQRGQNTF